MSSHCLVTSYHHILLFYAELSTRGVVPGVYRYIHCVSKNRTLEIFSNISNKAGPISIILVQRIINKYAPTDAYNFAICCKTENQLRFSAGNQSSGWRTIII